MSVIDEVTAGENSAINSKKNTASAVSSDEFRKMLEGIEQRQNDTLSLLDGYKAIQQQRFEVQSSITTRLQRFFTPQDNFSNSLSLGSNWFSSETGARDGFLDLLDIISQNDSETAAGVADDLFNIMGNFSNAFGATASTSQMMFTSISSFSLKSSFSSTISNLSGLQSGLGGLQGRLMTVEAKMEQVEQYSIESVEDHQLLSNGGNMVKVEGKYINISVYMKIMDPIVLDLGGDGLDLKSVEDGVIFDLAGDGNKVRCGFVQGDDALLFMDMDGDGVCSDGKELFGDQEGHAHGFAELSEHDLNSDGEIDDKDLVYSRLKVWNDYNGDGISQKDEIRSLREAGVEALSLGYRDTDEENNGNIISQKSFFRRFSGELGVIADANFRYRD